MRQARERQRRRLRQRLVLAQAFPVDHEEQSVSAIDHLRQDHRAAQREPVLIALERRDGIARLVEVVLRIEAGIAQELEHRAAQLIRTRLGRHVHLGDGAAVLRIEDPRDDVELLQRVDRRQQHVGVEVQVGVLDAVERVMVEVDALAGHVQRKAVALTAHALFALARRRPVGGGARNQRRQLQVIAPVERQLDDRAIFDNRADGGVLGLDQWRLTDDGHGLGDVAHIHREGDPARTAHLHDETLPIDGSEAGQLGFQVVGSGRDGGDHVQANLIGLHDPGDIRRLVGQRHRHAGHGEPTRVDDGPADFA